MHGAISTCMHIPYKDVPVFMLYMQWTTCTCTCNMTCICIIWHNYVPAPSSAVHAYIHACAGYEHTYMQFGVSYAIFMYVCACMCNFHQHIIIHVADTGRKRTLFHCRWANLISYNYL